METGRTEVRDERISRPPPEEEEDDDPDEEESGEEEEDDDEIPDAYTKDRRAVDGRHYIIESEQLSKTELLLNQDGATIAASNFEGVIEERLRNIVEPGVSQHDASSRTANLARRFMSGRPVRFTSQEEKAAVLEAANSISKRRTASRAKKAADPDDVQAPPKEHNFAPLPEGVQSAMIDKMVRGTYDQSGVLQGDKYKQAALNNIAKATTMNGSYLSNDGDRLLKKVRSLLPTATSQPQQQKRKNG